MGRDGPNAELQPIALLALTKPPLGLASGFRGRVRLESERFD